MHVYFESYSMDYTNSGFTSMLASCELDRQMQKLYFNRICIKSKLTIADFLVIDKLQMLTRDDWRYSRSIVPICGK